MSTNFASTAGKSSTAGISSLAAKLIHAKRSMSECRPTGATFDKESIKKDSDRHFSFKYIFKRVL